MTSFNINFSVTLKLAQLSGEGLGTAYEYYVKLKLITKHLRGIEPKNILVYGLPEKYGLSLDCIFLGQLLEVPVTVVDDRAQILDKLDSLLKSSEASNLFSKSDYTLIHVENLARSYISGIFDLSFNTEVLQRIPRQDRIDFIQSISRISKHVFSFVPNSGNSSHNRVSGLASMSLAELQDLCESAGLTVLDFDFLDMPPFPPGVKKPGKPLREGFLTDIIFIPLLKLWYGFERICPAFLKSRLSHISYTIVVK